MTTHKELQDIADFDHPFTVTEDGTVEDAPAGILRARGLPLRD